MMKKKIKDIFDIKKVISLTKVLCKDYFENLPLSKSKNSGQNTFFKICVLIAVLGIGFLSYYVIDFLGQTTHPQIFLNAYLLILAVIIMFQQIIASTNVYYFSKDLEYILPFPIKPIELLIARFNMLISISYTSILMFGIIPILLYGMMISHSILYYPGMLIVLAIFPIFFGLIISTIMLIIMQLAKIIKNKDVFQFVVTFIVTWALMSLVTVGINVILSNSGEIEKIAQGEEINLLENINNKIEKINNYILTINPSVRILTGENIFLNIFELIKILVINFIGLIIFIFAGKLLYLKNILKNIQNINKEKTKNKKINHNYKKTKQNKAYIKNEFKELIKTPTFFMQCVLPVILTVITLTAVVISIYPSLGAAMQMEEVAEQMPEFHFDITVLITIIVIFQILYTFSNLSITAISRKGKNAFFIKYIPISLYKQFLYLNVPQVILNIFVSIIVLVAAKYLVPQINLFYLLIMFIMGIILNIINSFLMLVVDLRKPNLEWDNETDAIKQNKNKLYQYVLTIVVVLILIYFSNILATINLNLAIFIILFILILILFIINKIIKNKINKLFNKIN